MDNPKKFQLWYGTTLHVLRMGTINYVKKYHLMFFVKIQKTLFYRDAKTEMLRKEYDYIDYTFRRT